MEIIKNRFVVFAATTVVLLLASGSFAQKHLSTESIVYNVRAFGAKGDGKALDSPSINRAIAAASSKGGGTVYLPPGIYRSFSIQLKSNIMLYLEQGSTLLA